MKKYYYCNFTNEKIKIYIGEFNSDAECWDFFNNNKKAILEQQENLTPNDKLWFMISF